jgi:hypothetical protein
MAAAASGLRRAGRADQPRIFPRICYRVGDALAGAGRRDAMRRYERARRSAGRTTRKPPLGVSVIGPASAALLCITSNLSLQILIPSLRDHRLVPGCYAVWLSFPACRNSTRGNERICDKSGIRYIHGARMAEPSWSPMCMREVRIEEHYATGHADVGHLRAVCMKMCGFWHAVFLEELAYVAGENRA